MKSVTNPQLAFLSCLYSSEHVLSDDGAIGFFLSCLYGSELHASEHGI
ncbi:TPA: hypothetical protein HIT53_004238 [Escherichia fergusonii]|nr:hypothetical protein [Escherichia fergusonii]HAI1307179.1 hypothetical protein [Escherichia fergusonii]